ncbi:hypothetical protein M5E06_09210 [Azospirillum sp. A1-3]|uniref:hypothetical protein n=1 Tax=Azospirillum sp. A1-3 TaxID=185874 RepID=UPI00207754EC|nr:hypothetical protein [Azospirillum sp. A1-3]MCM8734374.1 hypothetical protein [Azospirillum sp. A1-3]
MMSLSKIILLALVIGAVWFGWRWVNRVQEIGRARTAARRQDGSNQSGPNQSGRRDAASGASTRDAGTYAVEAEDMEKCPECGAYVAPRSAVSCGRPACPYGR